MLNRLDRNNKATITQLYALFTALDIIYCTLHDIHSHDNENIDIDFLVSSDSCMFRDTDVCQLCRRC